MDLSLISTLIGQLSIIGSDPALGYRGQAITTSLALLSTIIARGSEANEELKELASKVAQMVSVGREPTKAEWYELRDLSKKHHEILNPPEMPVELEVVGEPVDAPKTPEIEGEVSTDKISG